MGIHPGERVVKEEKFPNTRKLSHQWVCGEFWISEGNITRRKKQNKTKQQNPQNIGLTTTPSGEVAHMFTYATSERGLNRESCKLHA